MHEPNRTTQHQIWRRRALLLAGLAAIVWALSLLPWKQADTAPRPSQAQGTRVKDLLGREVELNLPVQKVVLGEGRQLYLWAALDAKQPLARIAAWRSDLMQADPDTYAQYQQRFPEIGHIPSFAALDAEQLIGLKPDVVLLNIDAQRASSDTGMVEKLAAAGIPVLYIDFRHQPMQNTDATIRLIGQLLGQEARAQALIAFRQQELAKVSERLAASNPVRPKVFIERTGGLSEECCLSFGDENFGRYVQLAGGENIAKNLLPGTFGQINPEQVLAANPAHVVVTSANWQAYAPGGRWVAVGPGADPFEARRKLTGYLARPAYAGSEALRERQLHAVWHQFYNSPYQFIAVQQMAKWFHPQLFADLDPEASFRELHQRFLPIDYQPGYFLSLRETRP
ncbi:ABC transporter substrate-binding protein [Paucibacter sp. KBW04]|uniref:ABC transporter substrate-binding protein n=1 Tax=Paucibacter sp. KBW04 TaxID=2153361 RepID=UPI000F5700F1|nr:ABC transporter substrate-binding protein [Paucibacter sp. KBW04]RQO61803.1 ABC transporter substrate-binding protein [Paucibacter sp. KBW04]